MRLPQKLVLPALAATAALALSACTHDSGAYDNRYYGAAAYNYPGTYDTVAYNNRYYDPVAYNNGYYGPAAYNHGYYGSAAYNNYGLQAYNNCGWPTWPCVDTLSGVVLIEGKYYANLRHRVGSYGHEFLLNGTWRKADAARPYG